MVTPSARLRACVCAVDCQCRELRMDGPCDAGDDFHLAANSVDSYWRAIHAEAAGLATRLA